MNDLDQFFKKEIKAKTYKGLYAMHKYWAKKPFNVISDYISQFTKEGDLVLDPFCGSGVVISESLLLKRKVIANDLNPVSIFITKNTAKPIDLNLFELEFNNIKKDIKKEIDELYEIPCPICNQKVIITHSIWKDDTPKSMWFNCTKCNKKLTLPVSNEFISKMEEVNRRTIPYWYPKNIMFTNSRINVKKDQKVSDLFTHRNLIASSIIYNRIEQIEDPDINEIMKFVFTSAVPQMTKLMFVIKRRSKTEGLSAEELGSWVAGYWMPSDRFELNAWRFFENRFKKVKKGKKESNKIQDYEENKNVIYLNESAKLLNSIEDNSVDYIFTDPPYADYVPYFEQSLLWASWLKKELSFEEEIVISDSKERDKTKELYLQDLELAFLEISKKLKPNKFITITFNSIKHDIWDGFLRAINKSGLKLINIKSISASACSVVQDSRPGSLKGDLYLTFQKIESDFDLKKEELLENKGLQNKILEMINDLIKKKGGVSYNEIFSIIMPILIENKLIRKENELTAILKNNYVLLNNKWHLNSRDKNGYE
jgi:16S rRNA G966 N2-methylase RsmD